MFAANNFVGQMNETTYEQIPWDLKCSETGKFCNLEIKRVNSRSTIMYSGIKGTPKLR